MPDPNLLYGITAVVVVGLVAWVAFVFKNAKVSWAQERPAGAPTRAAASIPPAKPEVTKEPSKPEAEKEEPKPAAKKDDEPKPEAEEKKPEAEEKKPEAEEKKEEEKKAE